ncbi:hypothetical protein [Cellulomonas cellasea]|uniref:Uncharacterized protein n=1 Tax=Cellulomonas cellasea TaxID=43670 RepID=A0A7W4YAW8_9CELL|nr:hypothetical protein [Cellulomonas cellasea]MBB2923230.1 hypothetical protein [Cellulomonas cellasea]
MTELFRRRAQSAGATHIVEATGVADLQARLRALAAELRRNGQRVSTLALVGHGAGLRGDFLVSVAGSTARPSREVLDAGNAASVLGDIVRVMAPRARVDLEGCWSENGGLPVALRSAAAAAGTQVQVSGFSGQANFVWTPARNGRGGRSGTVTVTGESSRDLDGL